MGHDRLVALFFSVVDAVLLGMFSWPVWHLLEIALESTCTHDNNKTAFQHKFKNITNNLRINVILFVFTLVSKKSSVIHIRITNLRIYCYSWTPLPSH
ncbi:hypothetical protein POJ06DRAFT_138667 [Lipomyces tetrasporus]|uniref:Uncharacterized protein n=1 Tax=Lipomyces tetrasporus TaxID=54092 RepID=A0AAD7QP52_9ASCO|nr:uncharacterized protein POJ06DRAFT_138667 [Lipomyces tetrasporus]KAJ8098655.1 hypothetical protein POJ06DRAFT_138667 [Lipomyces tetrasporus]